MKQYIKLTKKQYTEALKDEIFYKIGYTHVIENETIEKNLNMLINILNTKFNNIVVLNDFIINTNIYKVGEVRSNDFIYYDYKNNNDDGCIESLLGGFYLIEGLKCGGKFYIHIYRNGNISIKVK